MTDTVFDWFHVLTPLTLSVCMANLVVGFALKPEHRSSHLHSLSSLGYIGCLIGWCIMRLGISLHSMPHIMKVATIGWFILMPSLLLITGCCIKRLVKDKSQYAIWYIKLMKYLGFIFHYTIFLILKFFQAIFFFVCFLIATKRQPSFEELEYEKKFRRRNRY